VKSNVNIEQSEKPVNDKDQNVSSHENNSESQSVEHVVSNLSDKDENNNVAQDENDNVVQDEDKEAGGIKKKRKYKRKLPTVKQMKSEYDTIKAEWIKMKEENGEQVEENADHLAFVAIKEEDAKTRTKRHYKRKYPIPAIMNDELQMMKSDLEKFRNEEGQPSGCNIDVTRAIPTQDRVNAEKDMSDAVSGETSSIEKGKHNSKDNGNGDAKQDEPAESAKKGKGKKTNRNKNGKNAQTEADEISPLPGQQTLQSSSERALNIFASDSGVDQNFSPAHTEGEDETSSPNEEEDCSGVSSDEDLDESVYYSDNDNDLFTDNLLDDDLVAFCNLDEMRELQDEEDEDELY
jgi:hypothetical protein